MAQSADDPPTLLTNGPRRADGTVVLAHGAGAAMDTDFMEAFATGLADAGLRVVRFEFPYMAQRRLDGKRRPPNREPVLRETFQQVIAMQKTDRLVIGGKSMGGRIASLIADEQQVAGLVCLGYPFHPVGKPEKLRTEHLATLKTPTLIIQGERDPFGNSTEVAGYALSRKIQLHWLADGDHSFKPRKASGHTVADHLADATRRIVTFVESLSS